MTFDTNNLLLNIHNRDSIGILQLKPIDAYEKLEDNWLHRYIAKQLYGTEEKFSELSQKDFESITTIAIQNTQLQNIPTTIGNLTSLTKLKLWGCGIKDLPSELGNLSNLECLQLDYNQISYLPNELRYLRKLVHVYLSFNTFPAFPNVLLMLPHLTIVELGNNCIVAIPDAIGYLQELRSLSLNHNQIKTIPPIMGTLTQLQLLNLASNKIASIPDTLGNLTRLMRLVLQNNHIGYIPSTLQNLTASINLMHQEIILELNFLESIENPVRIFDNYILPIAVDGHYNFITHYIIPFQEDSLTIVFDHIVDNLRFSGIVDALLHKTNISLESYNGTMPIDSNFTSDTLKRGDFTFLIAELLTNNVTLPSSVTQFIDSIQTYFNFESISIFDGAPHKDQVHNHTLRPQDPISHLEVSLILAKLKDLSLATLKWDTDKVVSLNHDVTSIATHVPNYVEDCYHIKSFDYTIQDIKSMAFFEPHPTYDSYYFINPVCYLIPFNETHVLYAPIYSVV